MRNVWTEVRSGPIGQGKCDCSFLVSLAENLYVADSHRTIIDKITQPVLPNVQLKSQVTRIESTQEKDDDPTLRITTAQNDQRQVHSFDEVVVAMPMGCLKREAVTFEPPLPYDIRIAIENASISSLEKVYLAFPEAFWDRRPQADNNKVGPSEESAPLPGFANFLNPTTYAPSEHASWCFELNPLSNPEDFGENAQPALLFSLFGDSGHELTSRIKGLSPSSEKYFDTVNDFLKPYYSRVPNYSLDNPICTPTAVLATNWQNDEYAYGSYTNFKMHSPEQKVQLDEEVRVMRHAMPERGIWFAGEHVAPFVGLGTSKGAHWSGEMAAMRVLGANGLAGVVAGED